MTTLQFISRHPGPEQPSPGSASVSGDQDDVSRFQTFIFPQSEEYATREYQKNIVTKALLANTLVVLPTGLGKTFIAAVVMYNYMRWFPDGKIVFMAPTRPLVNQQIQACHDVVGIDEKETAEMNGQVSATKRHRLWRDRRVFYCTPQTAEKDLENHIMPKEKIALVVVDEAHRGVGKYAFVNVVQNIYASNKKFRVLALSATPGKDYAKVQEVVNNLLISNIEYKSETDIDVRPYVFQKMMDVVECPLNKTCQGLITDFLKFLEPPLRRLKASGTFGILPGNPKDLSSYQLVQAMNSVVTVGMGGNITVAHVNMFRGDLAILSSLVHVKTLMVSHGLSSALSHIRTHFEGALKGPKRGLVNSPEWKQFLLKMNEALRKGGANPKISKLKEILNEHFERYKEAGRKTSVIVFAQYRDSVMEIVQDLRTETTLRVSPFVGQAKAKTPEQENDGVEDEIEGDDEPTGVFGGSNGKKKKKQTGTLSSMLATKKSEGSGGGKPPVLICNGQSQKEQKEVVRKFRLGEIDVLVATCIGEEGLDIGSVDLIVSYDALQSPVRMIQRFGRAGRKRAGRIIVLVADEKEKQALSDGTKKSASVHTLLREQSWKIRLFRPPPEACMFPNPAVRPVIDLRKLDISEYCGENVGGHSGRKKKKVKEADSEDDDNPIIPRSLTDDEVKYLLTRFGKQELDDLDFVTSEDVLAPVVERQKGFADQQDLNQWWSAPGQGYQLPSSSRSELVKQVVEFVRFESWQESPFVNQLSSGGNKNRKRFVSSSQDTSSQKSSIDESSLMMSFSVRSKPSLSSARLVVSSTLNGDAQLIDVPTRSLNSDAQLIDAQARSLNAMEQSNYNKDERKTIFEETAVLAVGGNKNDEETSGCESQSDVPMPPTFGGEGGGDCSQTDVPPLPFDIVACEEEKVEDSQSPQLFRRSTRNGLSIAENQLKPPFEDNKLTRLGHGGQGEEISSQTPTLFRRVRVIDEEEEEEEASKEDEMIPKRKRMVLGSGDGKKKAEVDDFGDVTKERKRLVKSNHEKLDKKERERIGRAMFELEAQVDEAEEEEDGHQRRRTRRPGEDDDEDDGSHLDEDLASFINDDEEEEDQEGEGDSPRPPLPLVDESPLEQVFLRPGKSANIETMPVISRALAKLRAKKNGQVYDDDDDDEDDPIVEWSAEDDEDEGEYEDGEGGPSQQSKVSSPGEILRRPIHISTTVSSSTKQQQRLKNRNVNESAPGEHLPRPMPFKPPQSSVGKQPVDRSQVNEHHQQVNGKPAVNVSTGGGLMRMTIVGDQLGMPSSSVGIATMSNSEDAIKRRIEENRLNALRKLQERQREKSTMMKSTTMTIPAGGTLSVAANSCVRQQQQQQEMASSSSSSLNVVRTQEEETTTLMMGAKSSTMNGKSHLVSSSTQGQSVSLTLRTTTIGGVSLEQTSVGASTVNVTHNANAVVAARLSSNESNIAATSMGGGGFIIQPVSSSVQSHLPTILTGHHQQQPQQDDRALVVFDSVSIQSVFRSGNNSSSLFAAHSMIEFMDVSSSGLNSRSVVPLFGAHVVISGKLAVRFILSSELHKPDVDSIINSVLNRYNELAVVILVEDRSRLAVDPTMRHAMARLRSWGDSLVRVFIVSNPNEVRSAVIGLTLRERRLGRACVGFAAGMLRGDSSTSTKLSMVRFLSNIRGNNVLLACGLLAHFRGSSLGTLVENTTSEILMNSVMPGLTLAQAVKIASSFKRVFQPGNIAHLQ